MPISNHRPVSILFTIPNFITAGSGKALFNVVQRLDRDYFKPTIGVLRKGGALEADIEAAGIPVLELPLSVPARPLISLPGHALRAARQIRPYRFKIWHSYHYSDDYTEPLIAYMAGARAWVYTKKNMNWGDRAWYVRSLLATRIAAQNTSMLSQFFARFPYRSKVRLIPRGVNTEEFHPDTSSRLQIRQQLNLMDRHLLVGCVADLIPVKGHTVLLKAVAQIRDIHLVLAGRSLDDSYAATLRTLARELNLTGRVHFLDYVQDIPSLLSEIDLFVLPTLGRLRMEGSPVSLLEAMSSGRACIATNIPGSRDIIDNGKSGLLVPPEEVQPLVQALMSLAFDVHGRQRLGESARKRIIMNYTLEREVSQHEALYKELIGY